MNFTVIAHDVPQYGESVHVKRFTTGRYDNYVLRMIKRYSTPTYDVDWYAPHSVGAVPPPLDIQDCLKLWERTTNWHSMSPTEFVWRMFKDVP